MISFFKMLNESKDSAGNNTEYDYAVDAELKEVLHKIIMLKGVNIEIVGNWIWVDGNTIQVKNELKMAGLRWSRNRKKWYFHPQNYTRKSRSSFTMEEIRNRYGSIIVQGAFVLE